MVREEPLIELRGIGKSLGGVRALEGADFELGRGEIHGLVGENGAGKSTLMDILAGIQRPDEGCLRVKSVDYERLNPALARSLGISLVPQKLDVASGLTVAENLFLNNWPERGKLISWRRMRERTSEVLGLAGLSIDPDTRMEELGFLDRQMVVIARILFAEKRDVVILDEPTAALTEREIRLLFAFIDQLRASGTSFIFISHFLDEIFRICDRVTVLRDGRNVLTGSTRELDMETLVRAMVGESVELFPARKASPGKVRLSVSGLSAGRLLRDVSFELREGEVLGIAGLKGAGRTEMARAVCGLDAYGDGKVCVDGKEIERGSVSRALDSGMGYLTEDRMGWGIIGCRPVGENIVLAFLRRITGTAGILNSETERGIVQDLIGRLSIRTAGVDQRCSQLSGGNQQKVLLARLLGARLRVLFLDEPTSGIDVKAKSSVHRIMNDFVGGGGSVVLISSDYNELVSMSDRIVILRDGVTGEPVDSRETDPVRLRELLDS